MIKVRLLSAAVLMTMFTSSAWAFSIDDVAKQAKALADKGYEAPKAIFRLSSAISNSQTTNKFNSIMTKRTGKT